jgi:hypothetical protein
MPHDIVNGHHIGHNHMPHDHLHSHLHPPEDEAAELQVLATQFIDGFVQAADKTAYLRWPACPSNAPARAAPALKLVDVKLTTEWQVGTASPSFGSRELSYLPFPARW